MTVGLAYQSPDLINIRNNCPFVKEITYFVIPDSGSILNVEIFWTGEGYFFPLLTYWYGKFLLKKNGCICFLLSPFSEFATQFSCISFSESSILEIQEYRVGFQKSV